ncbi:MAG: phosphate propanoyltransferase [Oscillospiraceae bacterium]|nr:phosphate propanoyltransferase [Oscillospiraceae bacterium]
MSDKILVEVSARHLHLCQQDLETLFGADAQLHNRRELSQPGQYVCEERVEIVGPKSSIKGVSVLGPLRPVTQVEVSLTDARALGITVPVRESGVLEGSSGCTIVGPAGKVELKEGLIAAKRHIHTTPQDAAKFGVKDKEVVKTKINTHGRSLIFDDVVVRVSESFNTAMHIDTDEAQAALVVGEVYAEIVK